MDRLLENAIREFELFIEDEVERNFAIACAESAENGECEIPWIGYTFDFRKPHAHLRNTVVRALATQFWCGQTNPEMPLLPLRDVEIMRTQINANPMVGRWGRYAEHQRDSVWRSPRYYTFDWYCRDLRRLGMDSE